MKKTRWGIVGPGNIANQFIEDLQWSCYQHEIKAVVGRRKKETKAFAQRFNIQQVHTEISEMIAMGDIDVVYIATPHPNHYEQVLACLNQHIAVLCEKPLVLNTEQGKNLVAAAVRNNTFLMEGMWLRFLPSIQQVLSLIENGSIGSIVSIKATITYKAPANADNRYFDREKGGGSLLDLGVYSIFLSTLLLGAPSVIKAIGKLTAQGVDESACILLQYPNGAYAMLDSSLVIETHLPAEITGTKGIIRIHDPWYEKATGVELVTFDEEGTVIYPCQWKGHGLYFEVDEVVKRMQASHIESAQMNHAFSLTVLAVMDEVRRQIDVNYDKNEKVKSPENGEDSTDSI